MADENESIPVDLLNPGQVFACLGFLEAADVLLGQAEGGFDWTDDADVRFQLRAPRDENPFGEVLRFLANARVQRFAPPSYSDPPPSKGARKRKGKKAPDDDADEDVATNGALVLWETFPGPEADWRALPVRLAGNGRHLDVSHWCDASSRNDFKLFAGQQRGPAIASAMIEGVADLCKKRGPDLVRDPFGVTSPMGGSSFKFDARKSWTPIDAGYSPDEQKHLVMASPVVEILAAVGLEHARPDEFDTREVRYGVWSGMVRPLLARPALGAAHTGIPQRVFRFTLDLSGKNKVVTFAEEETDS
jgi:CRISPR-associated protein Csx14